MATEKMSTLAVLVFVCALAGVSHGAEQSCSMDQKVIFPKLISCLLSKHPQYITEILTKMDKPTSMENPDFLCKEEGLMTSITECALEYLEGCMPSAVASKVAEVLPNHDSIQKGIAFICKHRNDFDDQCIESRAMRVGQCIQSKMTSFTHITGSRASHMRMKDALCFVLQQEEQCLEQSLAGCPAEKVANIKDALLTFFPNSQCARSPSPSLSQVLRYQPGLHH